jgi:hypothetical protein
MPNKQIKVKNLPKKKVGAKTTTTTVVRTKPNNQSEISMGRALLRALGGLGGGAAGLLAGSPAAGANYGYSLGNSAATILGLGSYSVRSNSLYNNTIKTGQVPDMHSTSQSTIVRHKEYIGDVVSSGTAGAFNAVSFSINPGLPGTFPWLSGIADQYQEYTFKGLLFEFKSSSADAIASSTNTALGTVIMTTRYNPLLPAPTGKIDALNEYFTSDAKPSEDFCHFIECDPRENPFNVQYVRDGPVPGNIQNYDLGELYVCTQGMQGTNNVCGEIWASYEVELRKPIVTDNIVASSNNQFTSYATAGITTSQYFGTSQVGTVQGLPGCTVTLGPTVITIQGSYQGAFMLFYQVTGASNTGWAQPTFSATLNCTSYNGFTDQTTPLIVSPTGSAINRLIQLETFEYVSNSLVANVMTITVSGGTFIAANSVECWIIPINNNSF